MKKCKDMEAKHCKSRSLIVSVAVIMAILYTSLAMPISASVTTGSIDISNTSENGKVFGKATTDEISRFETFTATSQTNITEVDLRVKRDNGIPSDLTVRLYATSENKPTGSALATASVSSDAVSTSFGTVNVPLTYEGLVSGDKYAIVVSQASPSDTIFYEWACEEVSSDSEFGRYDGTNWIDETAAGDGSVIIYVSGVSNDIPPEETTPGIIDISNESENGKVFGKATTDEISRYETFFATSHTDITGIDLRVKRDNGINSDLTASLYATNDNAPIGSALATASIAAESVSTYFDTVTVPLTYTGLVSGDKYAIVVSQASPSDTIFYEWACEEVSSDSEFGRYNGTNWIDESSAGDGSIIIYTAGEDTTSPTDPDPTTPSDPSPTPGAGDIAKNYGFEDGTTQGWAMDWGNGFNISTPVEWSETLAGGDGTETGTLKVNLNLNANGWQEANVGVWLTGSENSYYDFSDVDFVEYDIYVPDSYSGAIKISSGLNSSYQNFGPGFIDYNIQSMQKVQINGISYAKIHRSDYVGDINRTASGKLLIRIASTSVIYNGPIYIDNVFLRHPDIPVFIPVTPVKYSVIAGNYEVAAKLYTPSSYTVDIVNFESGSNAQLELTYNSGSNMYEGSWNSLNEPEGFQNTVLSIRTTDGTVLTRNIEVLIKNNQTEIDILSPAFDSINSGTITVSAKVTPSDETLNSVVLSCDTINIPMTSTGGDIYTANLDTTQFRDGIYTLVVKAQGSKNLTKNYVEVNVQNYDYMNYFVEKSGTGSNTHFSVNGINFDFVGWNTYDMVYKGTYTMQSDEKIALYTSDGELIEDLLSAATLSYEEQVDRMIIEGKKTGSTVVRVWGYHTDPTSYDSFYNADWSYKESQFEKFDYIMDSAKRHGVRVMITLQNYWDDYGGIKAITNRYGLGCKLEYFTNTNCKNEFKDYFNFFANRINTVNGMVYKNDPTIFAWELMNEPRMDYYDDNTPGKTLYSPDGVTLGNWIDEMSTYIKSVDSNHLVSSGSEGHGAGWCRSDEGYGDNPIGTQAQPNIDIVSCHPYPNEVWADFTMSIMDNYINNLIMDAHAANKAIIMGEFNVNKTQPLRDNSGVSIPITDSGYYLLRQQWFAHLLSNFRLNGGNGAVVWVLQNTVPFDGYGVFTYSPAVNAIFDRPFAQIIYDESKLYNPQGVY